jgi:hypothetical protein
LPCAALDTFLFVSVGLAVALCTARAGGAARVRLQRAARHGRARAHGAHRARVRARGRFGALAGVGGYAVSFRAELPVGATQAALAVMILGRARWADARRSAAGRAARQAPPPSVR